jgi:endonuclease/exonuclease/phosphatase family metal-dependent hydrolase
MLEWIAQNHLVIHNKGRQPTFKRGEQESHMDLMLSTENVANRIVKWTVQADEENFSDHQNITFEIQSEGAS